MKTVKQVSELTGISVRTLHHYDSIGLLKPSRITEAGYRLYDGAALERLHAILLLRQLHFPLKEIRAILDSPGFDPIQALTQQVRLLELQMEQLDKVIAHARAIIEQGEMIMDFSAFNTDKLDRYTEEARQKWGATDTWQEYSKKTAGKPRKEMADTGDALMDIFRQLGALRGCNPEDERVQSLVAQLQRFITDHYYTCTRQILHGLGQMYAAGGEMTDNIDAAGGPGTAALARDAISIYCRE